MNQFKISAPDLPSGENRANFTLKKTADEISALLCVKNADGSVLAKRTIESWQFEGKSERTFGLSYIQNDDAKIEYVVESEGIDVVSANGEVLNPTLNWPIGQQLPSFPTPEGTLDYIDVTNCSAGEKALFVTLKGLVNRKKPRIHSCEGNAHDAETWPEAIGISLNRVENPFMLVEKYKSEVNGIIITDPEQPATVNLATSVAGELGALVATPELARILEPFGFPVLEDYRGRFKDMFEAYKYLYDQWLPGLSHRILVSLAPETGGCLREYVPAAKLGVVWFDPRTGNDEKYMLDDFIETISYGGCCMGWWPEEGSGIDAASIHGVPTIPSDFSVNLTVYGGTDRKINIPPAPEKPELKNKIYVSLIMSDGDNLQYVEHRFKDLWDTEARGTFPLGWTISPAMVDAAPGLLNWIYSTATENDCLISGPSGMGYTYPNHWRDEQPLIDYLKRTESYCTQAGFRVVTIWGHSVGSATVEHVGNLYAKYVPSLLGITGQRTGGGWRIYDNTLPNIELTGSYCSELYQVKEVIENGAKEFDGTKPVFLAVQPVPWGISVEDLKGFAESLGEEYELVRPDIFFKLYREAHGLTIDPLDK